MKSLINICFILINFCGLGQVVDCGNMSIKFDLNENFKDTLFNYEEGFFKSFIDDQGNVLDVHCGALSKPKFEGKDFIILLQKESVDKIIRFGLNTLNNTYWREDRIKKSRLVISFFNVSIKNVEVFNRHIDTAIINRQ